MKRGILLLALGMLSQLLLSQIPYKLSPSFADDIILHNSPQRNQRLVAYASAVNGWEHTSYSYTLTSDSNSRAIIRSENEGEMWSLVWDPQDMDSRINLKLDLLSTGDSLENLYLVRLLQRRNGSETRIGIVLLDFITLIGQYTPPYTPSGQTVYDGAFTNDNFFPATGSDEGSLAMVYSKRIYPGAHDSISVWTSSNQGILFDIKKTLYSSNEYLDKVDISYGHAPSVPDGKYFVVWDAREYFTSSGGKIYYSHNTAGFSSSYSAAVDLSQFLPGSGTKLRNPRIAVQTSAVNNGIGNVTAVVLAEKYDIETHKSQIVGFVNDKAATDDNNWRSFTIGDTTHNLIQPDIAFNHYDSTFMVVYFDSTEKKIPYLLHKFDFEDPVVWDVVNPGINDSDSITNPSPQVKLCYGKQAGAVVWSSDNEFSNGVARYDAPFHYYTRIKTSSAPTSLKIYPNPASSYFTVDLSGCESNSNITMITSEGKEIMKMERGKEPKIQISTDGLTNGFYMILVSCSGASLTGKIIINK